MFFASAAGGAFWGGLQVRSWEIDRLQAQIAEREHQLAKCEAATSSPTEEGAH